MKDIFFTFCLVSISFSSAVAANHESSIHDAFEYDETANLAWLKSMKASGYTAFELKDRATLTHFYLAGFPIEDLLKIFGDNEFSQAKIPAEQLRIAGVSARKMRVFGYRLEELLHASYGFIDLVKAGFDPEALLAKGLNSDEIISRDNFIKLVELGFGPEKTAKLGFTLELIKEYKDWSYYSFPSFDHMLKVGFSLAQMVILEDNKYHFRNYKASELREAGMSIKRMFDLYKYNNGYLWGLRDTCSLAELKEFASIYDLKNIGYPLQDYLDEGYTLEELISKQIFTIPQIKGHGFNRDDIDLNKCRYGLVADLRRYLDFSLEDFKQAEFSLYSLCDEFDLKQFKEAQYSLADLKKMNMYPLQDFLKAGYPIDELREHGFQASEFKRLGYTATVLKRHGFTAKELKYAGYTFLQRRACGF